MGAAGCFAAGLGATGVAAFAEVFVEVCCALARVDADFFPVADLGVFRGVVFDCALDAVLGAALGFALVVAFVPAFAFAFVPAFAVAFAPAFAVDFAGVLAGLAAGFALAIGFALAFAGDFVEVFGGLAAGFALTFVAVDLAVVGFEFADFALAVVGFLLTILTYPHTSRVVMLSVRRKIRATRCVVSMQRPTRATHNNDVLLQFDEKRRGLLILTPVYILFQNFQ